MLLEVKKVLKKKLEQELKGVSIYRARIENKKIGGIAINTIYDIIKDNPRVRTIHNSTIISLLKEFNVSWDKEFLKETGIVKLCKESR